MVERPVRDTTASLTSKIPAGPLGFAGEGDLIGGVGYFTVATANGVIPVDGVEIGFDVESHNIERSGNVETHTFKVHSVSENVARFVGKYRSSPTFFNRVSDDVEVLEVEEIKRRRGFSIWRVVTEVESSGEITDTQEKL